MDKKSLLVSLCLHATLIVGLFGWLTPQKEIRPAGVVTVSIVGTGTIPASLTSRKDAPHFGESPKMGAPISAPSSQNHVLGGNPSLQGEGGTSEILQKIRNKIERQKFYPLLAKRSKIEGAPMIELKIKPDGSLEYVALKKSSGSSLLDEAAIKTVSLAAPYPYYPDPITLDIHYRLGE
ncbi:MAG: energy transducer TonB [Deltaproteobacteria bacterium]|nr:energy transducer TonB [Deltaproteobacteria bacterium]